MANSYIEYTSGLTATTYDVPFNVLSITDVNVTGYNGTTWSDLTVSSRDATAKTITLSGAPSAYQKIRVWRNTSATQLVDFQNGSRLSESDLDTAYQQGLFVAQEVSENASTNIQGIGPQGPQGIQGVAGNDGADGADGTSALPDSFESTEQTIGNVTVTHGLGGVPKLHQAVLRCKDVANVHGYAVGDEVDVNTMGQSASQAYDANGCYSNSTTLGFIYRGARNIPYKDGSTYDLINTAHWKLVFRAFA